MTTVLEPWLTVDDAVALLASMEGSFDDVEGVDELAHALQTADRAVDEGADAEMVSAALLHDVGRVPEVAARFPGMAHEESGAALCRAHGGERMGDLVAQHVPAKRYLVAVDPAYAATLSPVSVRSLARQGGPMDAREVADFEAHPWARDAAQLRRWDDEAKVPGARTRSLAFFAVVLRSAWRT